MKKRAFLCVVVLASIGTAWLLAQPAGDSLVDGFKTVEVASVSDAIEQLYGQRAYMSHEMRPLAVTKFAGTAVTVQLKREEHKEGSAASQGMLDAIDAAAPGSVYVMVLDNGAGPGTSSWSNAGIDYAGDSWRIAEHSNVTADGPPVYQFKTVIPVAGALVFLQGIAEVVRCVVCLRTGVWPSRLKDVAEIDVVEEQLAHSEYVDDESRKLAIANVQQIDEAARQRGMGGDNKI